MWIFKLGTGYPFSSMFVVGFYTPKGKFFHIEEYATREEAANRVHFLNGGDKVN